MRGSLTGPASLRAEEVGVERLTAAMHLDLHVGSVFINCQMLTNEMPHGGLKQSGYGKDMSAYALEDYTVARHVMVKL